MNAAEVTTAAQGRTVCTGCGGASEEPTCGRCMHAAELEREARAERWALLRYRPELGASFR